MNGNKCSTQVLDVSDRGNCVCVGRVSEISVLSLNFSVNLKLLKSLFKKTTAGTGLKGSVFIIKENCLPLYLVFCALGYLVHWILSAQSLLLNEYAH